MSGSNYSRSKSFICLLSSSHCVGSIISFSINLSLSSIKYRSFFMLRYMSLYRISYSGFCRNSYTLKLSGLLIDWLSSFLPLFCNILVLMAPFNSLTVASFFNSEIKSDFPVAMKDFCGELVVWSNCSSRVSSTTSFIVFTFLVIRVSYETALIMFETLVSILAYCLFLRLVGLMLWRRFFFFDPNSCLVLLLTILFFSYKSCIFEKYSPKSSAGLA